MGVVIPIKKFEKPTKGKKRSVPKGIYRAYTKGKVGHSKFRIHLNKDKYIRLYHKAKKECNTAAPVHDVLELLLQYYVDNEFLVHRRMVPVGGVKPILVKGKKITRTSMPEEKENGIVVWMRVSNQTADKLNSRQRSEGLTKSYIANLLVDFYLSKQFYIKTKIIRTSRYLRAPKQ